LGESYASGVKFAGWVALVRSENKVLAYKASTPGMERMIAGNTINDQLKEFAKAK
jgi:hypothetical protein